MSLKERGEPLGMARGNSPSIPYTLESNADQYHVNPYEKYPILEDELYEADDPTSFSSNYRLFSIEEKKKHLVVAQNNLELLYTILGYEAEPKPLKVIIVMLD
ncbi:hypothetical protein Fmac_020161 [Flemingia macrophylla]|uniref:Uncharacterized protein n=1 Tax=Flemingia macrophylla TaxID=520843 RepID=A0ABD1LT87_9FABA